MLGLNLRIFISFLICIPLMFILVHIAWGVTLGIIASDKAFNEEILSFFKDRGVVLPEDQEVNYGDWYNSLPAEVKKDFENTIRQYQLQKINWFIIEFMVSVFTFAVTGFFYGYVSRTFISAGIIVILSFITVNPLKSFSGLMKDLSYIQKLIIITIAQFGISYLFGYIGSLLGNKRSEKG